MSMIPRPVVILFGRFNPPTTSHLVTIEYAYTLARRNGADVRIYPAHQQDPRENPLPFHSKVHFLRKFFPNNVINQNPAIRTEHDAITDVIGLGYTDILLLVASNRVDTCQRIAPYFLPPNSPKYNRKQHLPIGHYHVLGLPVNYDPDGDGLGVSSATMRHYAVVNDFDAFSHAVPPHVTRHDAINLFTQVRQYMGLRETFRVKPGQFASAIFEDEGSDTYIHLGGGDEDKDTESDRIRKVHQQELIAMKQRQTSELNAAKMRDVQRKAREAQMKVTKPKGPSA